MKITYSLNRVDNIVHSYLLPTFPVRGLCIPACCQVTCHASCGRSTDLTLGTTDMGPRMRRHLCLWSKAKKN